MKIVAALLLGLVLGPAWGADFYVEDPLLRPVPAMVAEVIAATPDGPGQNAGGKPCSLVGKPVSLREAGGARDWLVTTAGSCGWGAALGPVWALREGPQGYEIVLAYGAYDMTIGRDSQNGMHHLATGTGTAARIEEQLWKFDGRRYAPAKQRKPYAVDTDLWIAQQVEKDGGVFDTDVGKGRILNPGELAVVLLRASRWLQDRGINEKKPRTSSALEIRPQSGELRARDGGRYLYVPSDDYAGEVTTSFIVTIGSLKIRVKYNLIVVDRINESPDSEESDAP